MSNHSWIVSLQQAIRRTNKFMPHIAIIGVGHELRGDDAAGVMVARRLQATRNSNQMIIDAGPSPENFTGKLREFAPDIVILVDAIQINEPTGTICLLPIDKVQPFSLTTHTLSPNLLVDYLRLSHNCDVLLLGIQAGQDTFDTGMSPTVQLSVEQIARELQWLCGS